ncbi:hypothetical protein AG1IA_05104 [Rhizoctonia solani AG-1 IA]|uniref:Uncharacterized protein n=1 Tax=Thanatephorus cucumeris (strain AG1-IA) TaxID=983506 RepID=L8WSC2_THACA|nr:hypothetical protein AG1IA_05104 [Rhizoctonia solani AG-1 IA]
MINRRYFKSAPPRMRTVRFARHLTCSIMSFRPRRALAIVALLLGIFAWTFNRCCVVN